MHPCVCGILPWLLYFLCPLVIAAKLILPHHKKSDGALMGLSTTKNTMAAHLGVYLCRTFELWSHKGSHTAHTGMTHYCVCDPLWFRPVICMMPSRGWSLLLQVGDVRGLGGGEGRGGGGRRQCEAKPKGLLSIHISQFPVLCHQVLRSGFGLCHELHAHFRTHAQNERVRDT